MAAEDSEEIKKFVDVMRLINEQNDRFLESDPFNELGNGLVELYKKQGDSQEQAFKRAKASIELFKNGITHATTALAAYTKAVGAAVDLAKTQTGKINEVNALMDAEVAATNSMIDAAGSFAAMAVTTFLPGGPIVKMIGGAIVSLFTFFAKQKNELDNKIYKDARDIVTKQYEFMSQLGEAGAFAGKGMEDVAKLGESFNLPIHQMGPLVSAIGETSQQLVRLGGTVDGGVRIMERLGQAANTNTTDLLNMGVQLKDVPEWSASLLRVMEKTGRTQADTTKLGSEALMDYIDETRKLQAITGKSRKELEALADAAYEQNATSAALQLMDKKSRGNIEKFTQTIEALSPEFKPIAQGLAAFTTGTLNAEESMKVIEGLGPGFEKLGMTTQQFMEGVKAGTISKEKAAELTIAAMNANRETILNVQKVGGALGTSANSLKAAAQLADKPFEQMAATSKAENDKKKKGLTELDKANAAAIKIAQEYSMEFQKAMKSQLIPAIDEGARAFTKFGDIASTVYKAIYGKLPEAERKALDAKETRRAAEAAASKEKLETIRKGEAEGATPEEKKAAQAAKIALKKASDENLLAHNASYKAGQARKKRIEMQEEEDKAALREHREARKIQLKEARAALGYDKAKAEPAVTAPKSAAPAAPGGAAPAAPGGAAPAAPGGAAPAAPGGAAPAAPGGAAPEKAKAPATAPSGSETAPPTPTAAADTKGKSPGMAQALEAGLKIRPYGDTADGLLTPNTLGIAKQIQDMVPGFNMYTGLNDKFHQQKYPGSRHAIGQGLDFVLSSMPSLEDATAIKQMLQKVAGVHWVGNEYYPKPHGDANGATTGGHFHVQTSAADGAVLSGPQSGYKPNLTMHGTEAIIPLKGGAVPVSMPSMEKTIISLAEALRRPTMAGFSEYGGYNAGAMSTDLGFVKQLATQLGAFDPEKAAITNVKVWKDILASGAATNIQLGQTVTGSGQFSADQRQLLSEAVGEFVKQNPQQDIKEVLTTFAKQMYDSQAANMQRMIEEQQRNQDPAIQQRILDTLEQIQRSSSNTASAAEKTARAAYN